MTPVKLDTDSHSDQDHKGPIEMDEYGPQEGMLKRDLRQAGNQGQHSRIEGRHFQDIKKKFGDRSPPVADKGCAEDVGCDIHDDHENGHGSHGFRQVRMTGPVGKRRMGINHHDECHSDMTGIAQGGNGLEFVPFLIAKPQSPAGHGRKDILQRKEKDSRRKEQQIRLASLVPVQIEEDKAGQHHQHDEFAVSPKVQLEFAVQEPTCPDKDKERQDVVPYYR